MSGRRGLKRVEQVYELVERMHSIALRQAASLVHETEAALDGQCREVQEAGLTGRAALMEGDQAEWLMAAVQREVGARRWRELEVVRLEQEQVQETARVEYGTSRMKTEQIRSVIEESEEAAELIAGRRTQHATDDRYLSRLRWTKSDLRSSEPDGTALP